MATKKTTKKKPVFRVTQKIRNFIVEEVAGPDTLTIIDYLKGKENVSEFIIAQELEEEINVIRNKLYRLLNANLVSFMRKKDKQKGWYIYYWTLKLDNLKFLYYDLKRKRLERLQERLKREEGNHFFAGKSKAIRLDFDQAVSYNFICPETGEVLEQEDNAPIIKDLNSQIKDLHKEVDMLKAAL